MKNSEDIRGEIFLKLFDAGGNLDEYFENLTVGKSRFKQSKISAEDVFVEADVLNQINFPVKVLILAATWCGDCAIGVPAVVSLVGQISDWSYSIVDKDLAEDDFRKLYKTGGKEKVPVVVFATSKGEEIVRWVERSTPVAVARWRLKQENLAEDEHNARLSGIPQLKAKEEAKQIIKELITIAKRISYDR